MLIKSVINVDATHLALFTGYGVYWQGGWHGGLLDEVFFTAQFGPQRAWSNSG